jgi:hypothetical protein
VVGSIVFRELLTVLPILLAMLGIVLLAGLVVVYIAYPHRGQDVPKAAWIGTAMRKGVDRLPTLDNQARRADEQAGADDRRGAEQRQR